MNWLFIIVTLLPFLGYGIDGYNEKNIPKAIYTVGLFLVLATVAVSCTMLFRLYFVFIVPFLLIGLVLTSKSLVKKK